MLGDNLEDNLGHNLKDNLCPSPDNNLSIDDQLRDLEAFAGGPDSGTDVVAVPAGWTDTRIEDLEECLGQMVEDEAHRMIVNTPMLPCGPGAISRKLPKPSKKKAIAKPKVKAMEKPKVKAMARPKVKAYPGKCSEYKLLTSDAHGKTKRKALAEGKSLAEANRLGRIAYAKARDAYHART